MTDNITLPREVVERVETLMKIANRWSDDVDILVGLVADLRDDLTDLRAALAAPKHKHPGYVIGSHWLETAYSRICAGEAEEEVLRDCGWERVDDIEALRRDAERYRWLRNRAWFQFEFEGRYGDSGETVQELDAAIDAAMGEKR